MRIGGFFDDKNLGRAGLGNPYLPHAERPRKTNSPESVN
jgi:hypothetical protein